MPRHIKHLDEECPDVYSEYSRIRIERWHNKYTYDNGLNYEGTVYTCDEWSVDQRLAERLEEVFESDDIQRLLKKRDDGGDQIGLAF